LAQAIPHGTALLHETLLSLLLQTVFSTTSLALCLNTQGPNFIGRAIKTCE